MLKRIQISKREIRWTYLSIFKWKRYIIKNEENTLSLGHPLGVNSLSLTCKTNKICSCLFLVAVNLENKFAILAFLLLLFPSTQKLNKF